MLLGWLVKTIAEVRGDKEPKSLLHIHSEGMVRVSVEYVQKTEDSHAVFVDEELPSFEIPPMSAEALNDLFSRAKRTLND